MLWVRSLVRVKEKLLCVCIESGLSTGSATALVKKNISLGCALRYVLRTLRERTQVITIPKSHSLRLLFTKDYSMNNEIVIYQSDNLSERIEVKIDKENETFWLTQEQIGQLFERNRTVISKHLKNIFSKQELDEAMVSAFFAHTTAHGAIKGKSQVKMVKYYNLDAILSVGYRVNSRRGTQFRQWATQRLKDYLIKGYSINNRINRDEYHLDDLTKKVNQMDLQINTKLIPTQVFIWTAKSSMPMNSPLGSFVPLNNTSS